MRSRYDIIWKRKKEDEERNRERTYLKTCDDKKKQRTNARTCPGTPAWPFFLLLLLLLFVRENKDVCTD